MLHLWTVPSLQSPTLIYSVLGLKSKLKKLQNRLFIFFFWVTHTYFPISEENMMNRLKSVPKLKMERLCTVLINNKPSINVS